MKQGVLFKLGFRNLLRYRRHYVFLLCALSFCFTAITVISALSLSMKNNLYSAADAHYGGDIMIIGFDKNADGMEIIDHDGEIQAAVEQAGLGDRDQIRRSNVIQKGTLYFNGKGILHKNIIGVDFKNELERFKRFDFVSGSLENTINKKAAIISHSVAETLNARLGDDVTIKVYTKTGQINTGSFVIGGIINDDSIFGYYRCFLDIKSLNNLLGLSENQCGSIGLKISDKNNLNAYRDRLYKLISETLQVSGPITNKNRLTSELDKHWRGVKYFIVTLDVFVSQVNNMLEIIEIISFFLYIMLILITLISALVTLQLIINDRRLEIGIMKALGMLRGNVWQMLIIEFALLISMSLFAGLLFAVFLLKIVSMFSFNWLPGFEFFLKSGSLTGTLKADRAFINSAVIILTVLPAVWLSVFKISGKPCYKLLSGEKS